MDKLPLTGGSKLIGIIWVGAPGVAWLSHTLLGLSLVPADIPSWLWILLAAPLLEELAFRPLLQRGLQQRLATWLATRQWPINAPGHLANALVGLAFVGAHGPQQGWSALWWIVPSLAIGESWRRQQRLWPCVFMHAWFNACLVAASFIGTTR